MLRPTPTPEDFDPRVAETPSQALARQLREFVSFDRLGRALARAGLSAADLAEAHHAVVFAPEFTQSFKAAADDPAEVPPVWARAVVAQAMANHPEAPLAADADVRDALVAGLISEVTAGVQPKGLAGEWLGHALAVFGTRHALSRRGRYTRELIVPAVGDVLVYQGRGRAIRQRIRDSLPEHGPVVLLTHSLGGVACVDLLAESELPQVELLVTVGSQAPFFYEIDALQALHYGQSLPAHFPRWLNLYDPRDFLSYIAGRIFAPGPRGVDDALVNNRLPFPGAHSAYWTNPQTWDAIGPALPRGPER